MSNKSDGQKKEKKQLNETLTGDDDKIQKQQIKSNKVINVQETLIPSEKILRTSKSTEKDIFIMEMRVRSSAILNTIDKIKIEPTEQSQSVKNRKKRKK